MTQDSNRTNHSRTSSRANYLSNPAGQFGKSSSKWFRLRLITIVIVLAFVGGIYYHNHSKSTPTGKQTVSQVVAKVSQHIVLPSGEQPTLATVSDIDKVKSQPFFAHAANGDEVLIYAKAKKAILYRPSIDRLLEVAPLTSGTSK